MQFMHQLRELSQFLTNAIYALVCGTVVIKRLWQESLFYDWIKIFFDQTVYF